MSGLVADHVAIDSDVIVIVEIFRKTTTQTPEHILDVCRLRLKQYDGVAEEMQNEQGQGAAGFKMRVGGQGRLVIALG